MKRHYEYHKPGRPQRPVPPPRTCGTMDGHLAQLKRSPEYRKAREEIEQFTREYIKRRDELGAGLRTGIISIPVVVHVVYNTATQNITDAQIQSQIDVLNEDFRALNTDISTVPADFSPVVADSRIEFQLAVRDPDCQPTTGITRTSTTNATFDYNPGAATAQARNPVKFSASGGIDAWPADHYFNIWVCNLAGDLMGYGAFPGTPADEDGLVVDYQYFGDTGTATSPYDLGRTATHEIGHCLNLFHIWGDDQFDADTCAGSDQVDDTPNQAVYNVGCPSHPSTSCGNSGDMFMNYMDYVDDACMVMFSAGQAARMEACLHGPRAGLLASDGLIPPSDTTPVHLWMRDTFDDIGNEPNAESDVMYRSLDIWVRHTNDGITQQEHQNPIYRTSGDRNNYVYVRVRSEGCSGETSGRLKLYWAKASTALSWPAPWDGSITTPALMGEAVGEQDTGNIAAGNFSIFEFPWEPPNPADYASFGADQGHFCLLARIETDTAPPYGMTFDEGANLGQNVRNNKRIVWKNITVAEDTTSGGRFASVIVGNMGDTERQIRLRFRLPRESRRRSVLDWGAVYVELGEKLWNAWKDSGQNGDGVKPQDGTVIQVTRDDAWIELKLGPKVFHSIHTTVVPYAQTKESTEIFFMNIEQEEKQNGKYETMGGQEFVLKTVGHLKPPRFFLIRWILALLYWLLRLIKWLIGLFS